MKTAHEWAVILTHERMTYGEILEGQPEVLNLLKKALFKATKELIQEAIDAARSEEKP